MHVEHAHDQSQNLVELLDALHRLHHAIAISPDARHPLLSHKGFRADSNGMQTPVQRVQCHALITIHLMKHEVIKLVEFFIRQGFKGQGGHKAAARMQVNGMRAVLA